MVVYRATDSHGTLYASVLAASAPGLRREGELSDRHPVIKNMATATTTGLELTRTDDEIRALFSGLASRRDVADLLEVTYGHLTAILYGPQKYRTYYTFDVKKRSGGARTISAPPAGLKILQSKLNHVLQVVYRRKPGAHGFVRGYSIVTGAQRHARKRWVLNLDLADFFPSIHYGRVQGMFEARPYEVPVPAAKALARICCDNSTGELPQGAPSSPMVSNMLCAKLDAQLAALARKYDCAYSRYADDLTFSTNRPDFPSELASRAGSWRGSDVVVGHEVRDVVETNGFRLNDNKQRLQFQNSRQEVTGLIVNSRVNVKRRTIRQMRALLHACERYGFDAAEKEFRDKYDDRSRRPGSPAPSIRRVMRGKLEFIKMVRGEDDWLFVKLANKLHDLDDSVIGWRPVPYPGPPAGVWQHWQQQYADLVHLLIATDGTETHAGTAFNWGRGTLATAGHNTMTDANGGNPPEPRIIKVSPPCIDQAFDAGDVVYHPDGYPTVDAALLRVPAGFGRISKWIPARTTPVVQGEPIAVIGYRSTLFTQPAFSLLSGHVQSIALDGAAKVTLFQMSMEASPALSGAPVIDEAGRLVGMVLGLSAENLPQAQRFNHALPIGYLLESDDR